MTTAYPTPLSDRFPRHFPFADRHPVIASSAVTFVACSLGATAFAAFGLAVWILVEIISGTHPLLHQVAVPALVVAVPALVISSWRLATGAVKAMDEVERIRSRYLDTVIPDAA